MKASTQYSDLIGSSAADIVTRNVKDLNDLAQSFGIDLERFEVLGISFANIRDWHVSFICRDKEIGSEREPYILKLALDHDNLTLDMFFDRLNVVLYRKFDNKYPDIDEYHEARLSDYK